MPAARQVRRAPAARHAPCPRWRSTRPVLFAALFALASVPTSAPGQPGAPAQVVLTRDERAWLTAHEPLRFAPDPAFPPIEWFDEEGRYRGMVADYFELIQARLGTRIEIVRVSSWDEALRRARAREVDGLTAAQPTPERATYLTGKGSHRVNPNLTRCGGTITCEWFNTTLADDASRVYGVMSLALDVSER